MKKDYFSTGEAAEIARVSRGIIIKYCNSNKIKYFRVPGSITHRRILLKDLEEWMIKDGIPVDLLEKYKTGERADS